MLMSTNLATLLLWFCETENDNGKTQFFFPLTQRKKFTRVMMMRGKQFQYVPTQLSAVIKIAAFISSHTAGRFTQKLLSLPEKFYLGF